MLFIVWRHEAWKVGFSHRSLLFLLMYFKMTQYLTWYSVVSQSHFPTDYHFSFQKQCAVTPFFLCLTGPCTSTCTSLAFWLRSPCIKNTNPGKPVPPLKPFPPPPPPPLLHAQCSASLFTPTIMTKWTEPLHPTSPSPSTSRRSQSMAFSQRLVNIRKGLSANLNAYMYFVLFIYFRTWQCNEDQNLDGTNQRWHWMYSALLPFCKMKTKHQL